RSLNVPGKLTRGELERKMLQSQSFSTELKHPILRSTVRRISVPHANCGGLFVINRFAVLLLSSSLVALPAFAGQRMAVHPRAAMGSAADDETIREIIEMEKQAREASMRRDADFSARTLAEDYVAITPLGQVTTKQDTLSARKSGQLRYDTID